MKRRVSILVLAGLAALLAPRPLSAGDEVVLHGFVSQGYFDSSHNNYLLQSEEGSFIFLEMTGWTGTASPRAAPARMDRWNGNGPCSAPRAPSTSSDDATMTRRDGRALEAR